LWEGYPGKAVIAKKKKNKKKMEPFGKAFLSFGIN
jgi:hypothetical protein